MNAPNRQNLRGLEERTVPGLHDHVLQVIDGRPIRGQKAVDLGAGSGALALRLSARGFEVSACDADAGRFVAELPFYIADLNDRTFAEQIGESAYDLVTAIEVIEHVESPISFLRNMARLLTPSGVAIVTTPNVDSLPARLKFLLRGKIRCLDEYSDPTHLSPIFLDLLLRQYLPRSGLLLLDQSTFPTGGFIVGRRIYRTLLRPLSPILSRTVCLAGDSHVFTLGRAH